jgi:hypothetical protein
MQVPTSLGWPAPFMGVVPPSSETASSLNDDGWMGVLRSRQALPRVSSEHDEQGATVVAGSGWFVW